MLLIPTRSASEARRLHIKNPHTSEGKNPRLRRRSRHGRSLGPSQGVQTQRPCTTKHRARIPTPPSAKPTPGGSSDHPQGDTGATPCTTKHGARIPTPPSAKPTPGGPGGRPPGRYNETPPVLVEDKGRAKSRAGVPGLEPRLTEPESVGLPITLYPNGRTARKPLRPSVPRRCSLSNPGPHREPDTWTRFPPRQRPRLEVRG